MKDAHAIARMREKCRTTMHDELESARRRTTAYYFLALIDHITAPEGVGLEFDVLLGMPWPEADDG